MTMIGTTTNLPQPRLLHRVRPLVRVAADFQIEILPPNEKGTP